MGNSIHSLLYYKLAESLSKWNYPNPCSEPGLEIITFCNGKATNDKNPKLLIESLQSFSLTPVVLGEQIEVWKNRKKVDCLREYLNQCQASYVLICDCSDVFLLRPLAGILAAYQEFNCRALFGGEARIWPYDVPADILAFEKSKSTGPFCYLNSGLWLSDLQFAINLVREVSGYKSPSSVKASDQMLFKMAYSIMWPEIKVDSKCQIFQPLSEVLPEHFIYESGF